MPHGLVSVEAGAGSVTITSPVPIIVELEGQPPRVLQAGHHELSAG